MLGKLLARLRCRKGHRDEVTIRPRRLAWLITYRCTLPGCEHQRVVLVPRADPVTERRTRGQTVLDWNLKRRRNVA
jgi:hypothetical protein